MNYKTYKNNMSVQEKQKAKKKKEATFLHNTQFGINITRI